MSIPSGLLYVHRDRHRREEKRDNEIKRSINEEKIESVQNHKQNISKWPDKSFFGLLIIIIITIIGNCYYLDQSPQKLTNYVNPNKLSCSLKVNLVDHKFSARKNKKPTWRRYWRLWHWHSSNCSARQSKSYPRVHWWEIGKYIIIIIVLPTIDMAKEERIERYQGNNCKCNRAQLQ